MTIVGLLTLLSAAAATPLPSTPPPLGTLIIERPENNGLMNIIPCRILVEPVDGIVSARVNRQGRDDSAAVQALVLSGGDTAVLRVRPGSYSVRAVTRVEDQPPGYDGGKRPHDWRSAALPVPMSRDEVVRVTVTPRGERSTYTGGWRLREAKRR